MQGTLKAPSRRMEAGRKMAVVGDEMNRQLADCFLSSIAATLAVVFIQGCGGTGRTDHGEIYPPVPITVVLPYVESVDFSSEIHAGQPFTIVFELSCEQFPEALRSPARPFPNLDQMYVGYEQGSYHYVGVVLFRDPAQINATEPLRTKVRFDVIGLSAGEHILGFYAARTRSEGGMQIQVNKGSLAWLYADPVPYWQNVQFTVLP
jgi:hypothetical protein